MQTLLMLLLHKNITQDIVLDAVKRQMFGMDNPGFCIACGEEAEGCDPDSRNLTCDYCGERQVFGALLLGEHMVA